MADLIISDLLNKAKSEEVEWRHALTVHNEIQNEGDTLLTSQFKSDLVEKMKKERAVEPDPYDRGDDEQQSPTLNKNNEGRRYTKRLSHFFEFNDKPDNN